jgi:hypothetical protein
MKNRPARSFVPLGALALAFCSCVSEAHGNDDTMLTSKDVLALRDAAQTP